jgi:arylamine N-acetyltransferase
MDWSKVTDLSAHRRAAAELLEHYGVDTSLRGEDLLEEVAGVFSRLPYENVTKLIRKHSRPPGRERMRLPGSVVRDHLELGAGGTCFSLSCLFACAVERLGLTCYPVLARMRSKRTMHCGLVVPVAGRKFLLDPGYLVNRPVRLVEGGVCRTRTEAAAVSLESKPGDGPIVLPGSPKAPRYDLITDGKWRYAFHDRPLTADRFVELWLDSFDWTMMSQIHLSRSVEGGYLYVHGHRMRRMQGGEKSNLNIRTNQKEALFEHFNLAPELTEEACGLIQEIRRKTTR